MEPRKQRTPWTRGEKAILIGSLAVVLIVATVGVVDYVNNTDPEIKIPVTVLPNPNGFDYVLSIGQSVVDWAPLVATRRAAPTGSWHRLNTPWVQPPTPTFRQRQAGEQVFDFNDPAMMAAAEQNLKANATALSGLPTAFKYPYLTPPIRSFAQPLPYLVKFRSLTRVLALQADVDFAQGKPAAATTAALDAVHVGTLVPKGGVLIHGLVGFACQKIGRASLWRNIDKLDSPTLHRAASTLETDDAAAVSYVDALREQKLLGEAGLLEVFHQPHWQSAYQSSVAMNSGSNTGGMFPMLRQPMINKRAVMNHFIDAVDHEIALASQPYSPKPAAFQADPIIQPLLTEEPMFRFRYVCNQAENRLLMTDCALRAYKLDHGSYPSTLSLLVPGYLHAVPLDPFTASSPLAYRLTTKSYVLYSVGPDTVDNGGTAIATRMGNTLDGQRQVDSDAKGDMVAGLNL